MGFPFDYTDLADLLVAALVVTGVAAVRWWLRRRALLRAAGNADSALAPSTDGRTDPLTGLFSEEGFREELVRRMAEWHRRARPFCLLMVRVDGLKLVHDRQGRATGDRILQEIAAALKSAMREMDVVARSGGDEFAVIMPDTLAAEAGLGAGRARERIAALPILLDGPTGPLTVSQGLAEVAAADDAASVVRRAREALDVSRHAGRGCAHFHDGERCISVVGQMPPLSTSSTLFAPETHSA